MPAPPPYNQLVCKLYSCNGISYDYVAGTRARVYSGNTRINLRRIDSRVSVWKCKCGAAPHAQCARETVVGRVHVHVRVCARARPCACACGCACMRCACERSMLPSSAMRRYARTRVTCASVRARGVVFGRRSIMYRGLPLTSNFPNTAIIAVIIMARSF